MTKKYGILDKRKPPAQPRNWGHIRKILIQMPVKKSVDGVNTEIIEWQSYDKCFDSTAYILFITKEKRHLKIDVFSHSTRMNLAPPRLLHSVIFTVSSKGLNHSLLHSAQ
jgi:hypothetical protein